MDFTKPFFFTSCPWVHKSYGFHQRVHGFHQTHGYTSVSMGFTKGMVSLTCPWVSFHQRVHGFHKIRGSTNVSIGFPSHFFHKSVRGFHQSYSFTNVSMVSPCLSYPRVSPNCPWVSLTPWFHQRVHGLTNVFSMVSTLTSTSANLLCWHHFLHVPYGISPKCSDTLTS